MKWQSTKRDDGTPIERAIGARGIVYEVDGFGVLKLIGPSGCWLDELRFCSRLDAKDEAHIIDREERAILAGQRSALASNRLVMFSPTAPTIERAVMCSVHGSRLLGYVECMARNKWQWQPVTSANIDRTGPVDRTRAKARDRVYEAAGEILRMMANKRGVT